MKKKYANEDNEPTPLKEKKSEKPKEPEYKNDSASCFSSETEKAFEKKQKSKFEKLQNAFAKSFNPPENSGNSKWRDLQVRTIWSLIMIFSFILILSMGHFYCALFVLFIIICINSELIDISRYKDRNHEVKGYYLFSWYMFILGIYFFYVRTIREKIPSLTKYLIIHKLLIYHSFICFMLYIFGFFIFIRTLTKGYYRYQFRQFSYIHIIVLIFGVSSSLIVSNIFNGIFWFIFPASLVIVNDITAYIWGRMFGKHQLSLLSPKKTWEGFIGGFFSTIICGYILTNLLSSYEPLLCPVTEIGVIPFKQFHMTCDNSELKKILYNLSFKNPLTGNLIQFYIRNIHFHTFAMALFAGILAPLGGLFASGFKRAINIKDFADTIPGHGGLTDRMDCQLLMGVFTYVWLSQFYFFDEKKVLIGLMKKIGGMKYDDRLMIYQYLGKSIGYK